MFFVLRAKWRIFEFVKTTGAVVAVVHALDRALIRLRVELAVLRLIVQREIIPDLRLVHVQDLDHVLDRDLYRNKFDFQLMFRFFLCFATNF